MQRVSSASVKLKLVRDDVEGRVLECTRTAAEFDAQAGSKLHRFCTRKIEKAGVKLTRLKDVASRARFTASTIRALEQEESALRDKTDALEARRLARMRPAPSVVCSSSCWRACGCGVLGICGCWLT